LSFGIPLEILNEILQNKYYSIYKRTISYKILAVYW